MAYRPIGKLFAAKETEEFFEELRQFETLEDIHITDHLAYLLSIMIEIVMIKNRWLDPKGVNGIAEDTIQEIYIQVPRLLRNVWKRMQSPERHIENLYSYLFRALQSLGCNVFAKRNNNLEFISEIEDYVDDQQSKGELIDHIPCVYSEISNHEIEHLLEQVIDALDFPYNGKNLLACFVLCERYKDNLQLDYDEDVKIISQIVDANERWLLWCKVNALILNSISSLYETIHKQATPQYREQFIGSFS